MTLLTPAECREVAERKMVEAVGDWRQGEGEMSPTLNVCSGFGLPVTIIAHLIGAEGEGEIAAEELSDA